MENNFDPMTGEPVNKTENVAVDAAKKKIPAFVWAIGGGVVAVVLLVVALVAAGVFRSDLTTISDSLFSNCTGLKNVTIPANVTSVGNFAFWSCWFKPPRMRTDTINSFIA